MKIFRMLHKFVYKFLLTYYINQFLSIGQLKFLFGKFYMKINICVILQVHVVISYEWIVSVNPDG